MLGMTTTSESLTTGMREISEALGGGIKEGSLALIEGDSNAGKSVLSQYIAYGVLCSKDSAVALYCPEGNYSRIIYQMESLSLDVHKDLVTDRLRLYSLTAADIDINTKNKYKPLLGHIAALPSRFKLLVVDSITPLLIHDTPDGKMEFLHSCRELCTEQGRSIILSADTHLFNSKTLPRANYISDYYLKLRTYDSVIETGQVDERNIKILEVTKLNGADRIGYGDIKFEIKPKIGIQILPLIRVRV